MPVGNGGKFTREARAIYELVLEMQKVRQGMITDFAIVEYRLLL
jgi:Xaa-Pro dipeptidase